MRYALLAVALVACSDSTGPGIACESQKRAELARRYGTDFSPSDPLLRQNHWTFGDVEVTWAPDCTMTVH